MGRNANASHADTHENDTGLKENSRKRQEQALMFEKYLEESGLCLSF